MLTWDFLNFKLSESTWKLFSMKQNIWIEILTADKWEQSYN